MTETFISLRISGADPRIARRCAGEGPLVVFLHGIGGNSLNWLGQLAAIGVSYRAVAWDMRGYGESDDYDGPLRLDDLAADLLALIDAESAATAHLVGLSMGAMIALEFYRRHPQRVATLTLSNTNAGLLREFTAAQKAEFIALRKTPLLSGMSPADLVPIQLPVLLGEAPDDEAADAIASSLRLLRPSSYIKAIEAIVDFDSTDLLPRIDVPVLLIGSTDDKVTPAQHMASRKAAIAGAELAVIERAGHLGNIEAPEVFNAILRGFLARHMT